MNPRILGFIILVSFLLMPLVPATSDCPVARADFNPYNKVEIFNADGDLKGYKLINEEFTIKVTRVETDKSQSPLSGRAVKIYFAKSGTSSKTLVSSGSTSSRGEYKYTPTQVGDYHIEVASKNVKLPVYMRYDDPDDFGAVCGNGVCETSKMESHDNCPEDCTICGDATCNGLENKENCPDDCIICGDGICDDAEIGASECYCEVDCLVCGDGVCRSNYGEDCPEDCGGVIGPVDQDGDFLSDYWWAIAAGAAVIAGIIIWKKRQEDYDEDDEDEVISKPKKKKPKVEEDDNVAEIIQELIDSGISDKRIKGKLKEFGVEDKEATLLLKHAKR
jgi:hypothetical protein